MIDAFLRLRDRDREFMIALDWLGFSTTSIEIQHRERHHGESSYTLRRLIRVAVDGMFFRTTVLLRLVVFAGFLIALCGLLLAGFEVADYFTGPNRTIPGYTSLAVLVLVLSGVIIVSVGVVGMYVGRIFEQVKDRPLYLIASEAAGPNDAWRDARGDRRRVASAIGPQDIDLVAPAGGEESRPDVVGGHQLIERRLGEPLGVATDAGIGGAAADRADQRQSAAREVPDRLRDDHHTARRRSASASESDPRRGGSDRGWPG